MKMHLACVRLLGAAMLWQYAALSADTPPDAGSPALTIGQALQLAEQDNPGLKAAGLGLRSFAGLRKQAALRPTNELSFEVENAFGSGELQALDAAEMTLALSHVVELGEKRERRVAVVDAAEAVERARYEEQRVDLAAEVVDRFVQVAVEQERVIVAIHDETLAAQTLEAVTQRVEAALAPDAELHRARADLERARTARRLAELAQVRAMAWLASLWGARDGTHDRVAASLLELPELMAAETIRTEFDASPLARRLRNEVTLRESDLLLAESRSARDIALSGGVRYLAEPDDVGLVFSLSVPLAARRRNEGAIEEARATLDYTSALTEAELIRAGAVLDNYLAELDAVRLLFETVRERVMPELDAALEGTRAAYELGRYGYLELADAQARVINAHADLIDASARYHELLVGIERLAGQALARPAGPQGEIP
jgi:cobalt-zinc-cadmium efflux system outer membrane protein